jgi:hypothetical protein
VRSSKTTTSLGFVDLRHFVGWGGSSKAVTDSAISVPRLSLTAGFVCVTTRYLGFFGLSCFDSSQPIQNVKGEVEMKKNIDPNPSVKSELDQTELVAFLIMQCAMEGYNSNQKPLNSHSKEEDEVIGNVLRNNRNVSELLQGQSSINNGKHLHNLSDRSGRVRNVPRNPKGHSSACLSLDAYYRRRPYRIEGVPN